MLLNYESEIKYISKDFDEKTIKKLKINALISLNRKMINLESESIEKSLLELKRILRNILDKEPKQNRIYRKEFVKLKKTVIDEFGYYQKGSIIENHIALGLVFGISIGAALTSFLASSSGVGLVLGMAIGSVIGTKKEKEEEEAGNLY
ncbi:MAG: hypothetical protein KAH16_01360 [Candidatus Izimaplasma sp.]|nr:hypothetical protein [Candidatus Izimaplasma bacterium]